MKCANHPEIDATAFCRECGKPMCSQCQIVAAGSVYCAEHSPVTATPPPLPNYTAPAAQPQTSSPYAANIGPSPYTAPVTPVQDNSVHPGLAAFLGFIPGVGAIYNGQYAKGLVHAVVFGLLISLVSRAHGDMEPLFGILIAVWEFYMVFEAYHTARKRRHGIAVEEFSSLIDVKPGAHSRFPAGAVVLIVLGFVLLLNTTDIIDFIVIERFWPVGLIVIGLYLLYNRMAGQKDDTHQDAEARR
jgi:TM2 domain-containing membrane protein YozV